MKKAPRKMSSTFFSFHELSLSIVQGLVITIACLGIGYYFMTCNYDQPTVRTAIYSTLIFSNLFLTLANRSFYYSIFTTIRYKNNLLPIILFFSLVVLFLSIHLKPVRNIFEFSELNISNLLLCFIAAIVGVMWVEIYKSRQRKKSKSVLS